MIGIINALKHNKPFLHKIYKAKNGNLEQRSSDVEHFDVTGQIPRSIVFDKTGNIYSILERIGQGAFGVVKLAFNVTTAQLAAVKIQKISSDQRSAQDQLQIEEDLTKNLGRFYGSLYRTNPKGVKKHYLFMEYLRSDQNIFTKIKEASFEDKIKIALSFLKEIQHIHKLNFVHLDLSLYNILYTDSVKITDFGCSINLGTEKTFLGELRGTHLAPEMIAQKEKGESSVLGVHTDIFAAGMVLYEIFSENFYDAYQHKEYSKYKESYEHFYQQAIREVYTNKSKTFWKEIVADMIAEKPVNRPDLDQVIYKLEQVLEFPITPMRPR